MQLPSRRFTPETRRWAKDGLTDPRVKVFAGLRGSNTTECLLAVRDGLRERGVDESRLVVIDFEDPRFRRLKTANDVLAHLGRLPKAAAPRYLFLVSACRVIHHAELLRTLQRRGDEWNVWLAASTAHVTGEGNPFVPYPWMTVRLFWTDLDLRAWRFGAAETFEPERVALNRLYLNLRRAYENVYTPVGCEADFVTVEADGKLRTWSVNDEETLAIREFRAFYGGGGGYHGMSRGHKASRRDSRCDEI